MAANLNADLSLTPLLEKILSNPYGLVVCSILIVLVFLIGAIYFIVKSGVLSSIREHQEYKNKRVNDEIKDQEKFLSDKSFEKYKEEVKYHLDVLKLNKILKYTHYDKDLLEYILSCKNKNLAIFYYKRSSFYLHKSEGNFILKKYCTDNMVKNLNIFGTAAYFLICFGSLTPIIYVFFEFIRRGISLSQIPLSFVISQFILFFASLILALIIFSPLVKPWQAKKFLELEKIEK
ncbi:hypothetical protein [Acinetobacter bereziniae]|uniref:hypothetical protein n=1 Tax=Acinetobacter bereziniae TaxID=106648 RepID=UPI0035710539